VNDALDIAHVVLVHLADLLRKLPPEQIGELYDGTARLEIVTKGGRRISTSSPAKRAQPKAAPIPADQVRDDLFKIDDRAAATRYVGDLGLTVPDLKVLAKKIGVSVASKAKRDDTIAAIVQWTVGRRVDGNAVSRPAPSSF
jgi:hypothetical protein